MVDETKLWQEQARRLGGEDLVTKIEHIARDCAETKEMVAEMKNSAFPGGDIGGHKRYHEAVIERTAEMRRLRVAIQERTVTSIIWALCVFLALCVYAYCTGGKPPPFTIPMNGGR